jgi:hypothetical protein
VKNTKKALLEGKQQIKGGLISEPYLLRIIKTQSFFSITSYITGIIGLVIMIDGMFFVPVIKTRYGYDNYSLTLGFMFLLFSMVTNLSHVVFKKGD